MSKEQKQHILHFAVSTIGGFFGGYAVFNHCDLFGNAQTANLIRIVCKIFSGNFEGLIFLFLALATYIFGNVFYVVAKKFIRLDMRLLSLLLSAGAMLIIGLFPYTQNDYIAILPILFVTPVLWNSFRTAGEYATSPIFSTNNLRVAATSTTSYLLDKNKSDLKRAKFYWLTLLSFHTGVAMSCIASVFVGSNSIWLGFVNIILAVTAYFWLEGLGFTHHTQANRFTVKQAPAFIHIHKNKTDR